MVRVSGLCVRRWYDAIHPALLKMIEGGSFDMNHVYPLNLRLRHFVHFTLIAGSTDITIESIPAGVLEQDFHVYKVAAAVDTAPGDGHAVSVSVSNGTDTMTVDIADTATDGSTTTGAFDVDVSAQPFTLKYTEDAGSSSKKATCLVMYYYVENA